MDIAVLSDIHGNYIALKKCLDYALAQNIKKYIFLGDYVGELAYPEKTMQILYKMNTKYECCFIKGNKEDYWLNYYRSGKKIWRDNNSTTGALLYTYSHLNKVDLEFFQKLPVAQNLKIENMPQITICHGSPYKVNEKLLSDMDRTYKIMDSINSSIILCGHTHIQKKFEYNGKMVLNAGAVGVPLYSDGKSQFLILYESEKSWKEEFVSLEYEVDKVIEELHKSGLEDHAPYWSLITKYVLQKGDLSHGMVLARAMSLCNAEIGNCVWPDIPEIFWKRAVEELFGSMGEPVC